MTILITAHVSNSAGSSPKFSITPAVTETYLNSGIKHLPAIKILIERL
jgi:hypothetical protein